jgi:hypothetical protein
MKKDDIAEYQKAYRDRNSEHLKAQKAEYYVRNRETQKAKRREDYRKNKDAYKARNKKRYEEKKDEIVEQQKDYLERNREAIREYQAFYQRSFRRERVKHATPPWVDKDAVKAVVMEAVRLTEETGIPHEVDHIVPLRGKKVCGLHWHENLQVLPRSKNRKKTNRFDE